MQGIRGDAQGRGFGLTVGDKTVCTLPQPEASGGFVDWPRDSTAIAHPIPPGYKSGEQTSP
jgi:hypothetical protein